MNKDNGSGVVDVEVICHLVSRCINEGGNPDGDLRTLEKLLVDLRRTVYENRKINRDLFYGRSRF